MTFFTLERSGEFQVKTYGSNHCGTKSPLSIRYELTTVCGKDSLDGRGFLFDQTRIDAYFQNLKQTSLSCEVFSQEVAKRLYEQIMLENADCDIRSLDLKLSPEPYAASLTFSYRADEPAAPAVAPAVAGRAA